VGVLAAFLCLHCATRNAVPPTAPKPPFHEVDAPVPVVVRLSIQRPVANLFNEQIDLAGNFLDYYPTVGLVDLLVIGMLAMAEEEENRKREELATLGTLTLQKNAAELRAGDAFASAIEAELQESSWLELVELDRTDRFEPVAHFDTRESALASVHADQLFTMYASALYLYATVNHYPKSESEPSFTRSYLYVDGDADALELPSIPRSKAKGQASIERREKARQRIEAFERNIAYWTADDAARYRASLTTGVDEIASMIRMSYVQPEKGESDAPQSSKWETLMPSMGAGSPRTEIIRVIERSGNRIIGELESGVWVSVPVAYHAD
jgi:hypothetical protein